MSCWIINPSCWTCFSISWFRDPETSSGWRGFIFGMTMLFQSRSLL